MSSNYTGNSASTQAPSAPPNPGVAPTLQLPVDGDPLNAASVAQAFKALADFGAYASQGMQTIYVHGGFSGLPHPFFTTLAAAVTFAGTFTTKAKILVLGATTESAVPIQIPLDGLVIEGANNHTTVSWSTSGALIDLHGHNDVTINNLRGNYTGNASGGGTANALVTTTTGTSTHTTLNSCSLQGAHAEALITTPAVNGTATAVINCSVGSFPILLTVSTNCTVIGNTCGAITTSTGCLVADNICGNITVSDNSQVSGNTCNTLTGGVSCTLTGNILASDLTTGSSANIVTGNNVGGNLSASGGLHTINGNNVAGGLTLTADLTTITGNRITGNVTTDANHGNQICGNQIAGTLTLGGPQTLVQGNLIEGGDLVIDSAKIDNIITSNWIAGNIATNAAGAAPSPTLTIANVIGGTTVFGSALGAAASIQNTPAVGNPLNTVS